MQDHKLTTGEDFGSIKVWMKMIICALLTYDLKQIQFD